MVGVAHVKDVMGRSWQAAIHPAGRSVANAVLCLLVLQALDVRAIRVQGPPGWGRPRVIAGIVTLEDFLEEMLAIS